MKITVKHKGTEITIIEDTSKDCASMRWSDQNKNIQETIRVIVEEIIKLK